MAHPMTASTSTPATPAPIANALLAVCGCVVPGAPWPRDPIAACEDWALLEAAARKHGVHLLLYPAIPDDAASVPPEVLGRWKRERLTQFARNAFAERQLRELAAEFAAAEIPLVALKGAATFLWGYEDSGCRELGDLDLLIPEDAVPAAREIMSRLGYSPIASYTSAEEEEIGIRAVHLPPYVRAGSLPVELHVNILERRGDREQATAAIWQEAVRETLGDVPLRRLSWSHFLLHSAIHFLRHLEEDAPSLKGLADMVLIVRRFGAEIDWAYFWEDARAWQIEEEVARIAATLAEQWGVVLPGGPPLPGPIRAAYLVDGVPEPHAGLWQSGLGRIAAARELPTLPARLRYLFGLAFPSPAHLRWRYGVPEGKSLTPYYWRHSTSLTLRLLRNLLGHGTKLRTTETAANRDDPPHGRE